jgi:hypothetical protein
LRGGVSTLSRGSPFDGSVLYPTAAQASITTSNANDLVFGVIDDFISGMPDSTYILIAAAQTYIYWTI